MNKDQIKALEQEVMLRLNEDESLPEWDWCDYSALYGVGLEGRFYPAELRRIADIVDAVLKERGE